MNKKFILSIVTATLLASTNVYADTEVVDYATSADLDELQELVDTIETKTLTDRIKWSGDLRLRNDNFTYKKGPTDTANTQTGTGSDTTRDTHSFDKKWDPHYSVRLRLNMSTDITDDVKFTGRMVIQHDTQNNERICILSENITASGSQANTAFDIDKAYIDYKVTGYDSKLPVIYSMGILPTTGGLSSNIAEGTSRKSVFPSLMFDTNLYGGIVSADLSKVTGIKDFWIRGVAGKAFTLNSGLYYYQCNRETIQNEDVMGLFAESNFSMLGDNNTLYVGVSSIANIKATPYLGSSSAAFSIKTAKPMGDIINIGTGVEVRNINNSGLTVFGHFSYSKPDGNGIAMNFDTFSSGGYASGEMLSKDGHAYYVGGRYDMDKLALGAEFNHGSKYWWSATQGSEDVFNKLAVRGDVIELYATYGFTDTFTAKLGYYRAQENFTGSGWHFGEPAVKNNAIQENIYVTLDAKF